MLSSAMVFVSREVEARKSFREFWLVGSGAKK